MYLTMHPDVPEMAVTLAADESESPDVLPDPLRGISELGITCDSPLNSWTAGKELDPRAKRGAGKRLDYIYYSPPRTAGDVWTRTSSPQATTGLGQLTPTSCDVTFTDPIPSHQISFTDHFGVEAAFALTPATLPDLADASAGPSHGDARLEAAHGRTARAIECLNASIAALVRGLQQAESNQRFWLVVFIVILVFAVGLCIGSGFQPQRGVGSVFTFFAVAAGFGGTTSLYTGVIWGEWEKSTFVSAVMEKHVPMQGKGTKKRESRKVGARNQL